jgi:hypothetical protein
MWSAQSLIGPYFTTSWARTGSDTITAMGRRSVSLVAPVLNAVPLSVLTRTPTGHAQAWTWSMRFMS